MVNNEKCAAVQHAAQIQNSDTTCTCKCACSSGRCFSLGEKGNSIPWKKILAVALIALGIALLATGICALAGAPLAVAGFAAIGAAGGSLTMIAAGTAVAGKLSIIGGAFLFYLAEANKKKSTQAQAPACEREKEREPATPKKQPEIDYRAQLLERVEKPKKQVAFASKNSVHLISPAPSIESSKGSAVPGPLPVLFPMPADVKLKNKRLTVGIQATVGATHT